MRLLIVLGVLVVTCISAIASTKSSGNDPRLAKAYRFERGGWVYLHLEGSPSAIGFQHGYLLTPEIEDAFKAVQLTNTRSTERNWEFFRKTAREVLWPHIESEYRQELQGIADGLKARGSKLDLYDIVALNAFEEVPDYYVPWLNKKEAVVNPPKLVAPGNCSAFIATGSYTKDGKIVIAHNNWTSYLHGERWVVMFDIVPEHGNRMLMDGFPGVITSDDDFGVNSAGIMMTETTITQFKGFDPDGIPEFVRSRKALQYANSIDDYVRIIKEGNNGGYANDWLIGDRKTNEIAYLELGLRNTPLWRSKDGYFVSSNFARDPQLIKEETDFDPENLSTSPNARHVRWEELMKENKGKIDVAMAQRFLSDHYDSHEKKEQPDERTLCGHGDVSARGIEVWEWNPYYPGGAVQGKATDSSMAGKMQLIARAGHPCGEDFKASDFLAQHPEYAWQAPLLRDMKAGPWTEFKSGDRENAAAAETKQRGVRVKLKPATRQTPPEADPPPRAGKASGE
ncbi:MAG TPA: C45 family peptidase [Terriglobales bacterium]|nr:C45 family peptidase [Terriglobales bacterium]